MTATQISKSFLSQGIAVITIAVSSIVGFNYLADRNDKAIAEALNPLVSRIDKLEQLNKDAVHLLAVTSNRVDINQMCLNNFLTFYNTRFNKEFTRPKDIKEVLETN